jgi:hypothetical protein
VLLDIDRAQWEAALQRIRPEDRDVYFGPAFHAVHAAHGDGTPHASIVEDGAAQLLIPGLRQAIDGGGRRWDLQTCRTGCAGPLATDAADASFLGSAWAAWAEAMAGAGAVAAFFRLHPLVGNERWLPRFARVRDDRPTVAIDLTSGREHLWRTADSRHRNMVRKARRLGFTVAWNVGREAFEALYRQTMARLESDDDLRFDAAFFDALWRLPEAELATVSRDGSLLAAAVFIWGPRYGHYFLAARQPESGNHLGNLLVDAAIDRAVERRLSYLYLGGGRTPEADDALLRFKRSIGGSLVPYRVACVPVNDAAFAELVGAWTADAGRPPVWLLGYREPQAQ